MSVIWLTTSRWKIISHSIDSFKEIKKKSGFPEGSKAAQIPRARYLAFCLHYLQGEKIRSHDSRYQELFARVISLSHCRLARCPSVWRERSTASPWTGCRWPSSPSPGGWSRSAPPAAPAIKLSARADSGGWIHSRIVDNTESQTFKKKTKKINTRLMCGHRNQKRGF